MKMKINQSCMLKLIVICIILEGKSVYSVMINVFRNTPRLAMPVIMVIYILVNGVAGNSINLNPRKLFSFIFYVFLQMPLVITAYNNHWIYFFYFLILVPFLIIVLEKNKIQIAILYCNTIVFLSILSLLFYFAGSVGKVIPPTNTLLVRWGGRNEINGWMGLYYQVQSFRFFNIKVVRNSSIFTEPSVYGAHILMALAFLPLEENGKYRRLKYIILFLSCMTSFSTSGIIGFMVMSVIYFLINTKANDHRTLNNKIIAGLGILGLAVLVIYVFISSKYQSKSWVERTGDYLNVFGLIKDKWLLGMGYGTTNSIDDSAVRRIVSTAGRSNILGAVMLDGGLYMLLFHIAPILYAANRIRKKFEITTVLLILSYGMNLLFAPMPYTFFICLIWAYLYNDFSFDYIYKRDFVAFGGMKDGRQKAGSHFSN